MDLALLFLIVGAAAASLLRMVLLRLAASGRVSSRLARLPSVFVLVVLFGIGGWFLLVDRAHDLQTTEAGARVTLIGRVMDVARADREDHASVYILEDPTGRIEVATDDHPPQAGAFAIVRGQVIDYDGRRIVFADSRFSTF